MRLDTEYFMAMPKAEEWHRLRRDVTWLDIALHGIQIPDIRSQHRVAERIFPISEIQFTSDNNALLSRKAASFYLNVSNQWKECHDPGSSKLALPCSGPNPTTNTSPGKCKSTCFR